MIVVKIGGSLYDLPDLKARLTAFLATLNEEVIIIPGGGAFADVVREWDRVHQLGEEASHWLAIRVMDVAGVFLRELIDGEILSIEAWMREHDTVPHSWSVTSDSIAALVAREMKAEQLILLKSTDGDPEVIADDYFNVIRKELSCRVDIINMRKSSSPPVATDGLS